MPKPVGSEDEDERVQPSLLRAALRVGCAPRLDEDQAIVDAVELAKTTDAVVAVIGTNMDIEVSSAGDGN